MTHFRLLSWLKNRRERVFWTIGALFAVTVILLSCSTTTRTIMAPPSIPGAEFVGSNECATCHEEIVRDFQTATHAKLKAEGANAQNIGCETCHGPGSIHVAAGGGAGNIVNPKNSPQTCFQCHLEVRAKFTLPHHHPVLEGKMNCTDCHNPHKGSAVIGGGTELMSANETCFQCHTAQRRFVFEHEALREGCLTCHQPHGSVNQRMLTERNQTLCLKCHFQQQTAGGALLIGGRDHSSFVTRGTCWSAGCHEAVHGSNTSSSLRF